MPSIFRKNLHLCFFKIRCLPTSLSPPLTLDDDDDDDEAQAYHPSLRVSTAKFHNEDPSPSSPTISLVDDDISSSLSTSSSDEYANFSAIFASQRLIVTSPGYSNSILESFSSSSSSGGSHRKLVGGGVPINKYSPDPYADFRRSMQEMIEDKQRELKKNHQQEVVLLPLEAEVDENNDELLKYLQELLLCYLNLNPKHTHKFIIGAFADILVSLMSTHGLA